MVWQGKGDKSGCWRVHRSDGLAASGHLCSAVQIVTVDRTRIFLSARREGSGKGDEKEEREKKACFPTLLWIFT